MPKALFFASFARVSRAAARGTALAVLVALLSGLLGGCEIVRQVAPQALDLPGAATHTPAAQDTPTSLEPTSTPGANLGFLSTETVPQSLTLWLPPEFDPASGTPAGNLLAQRLALFSQQNDGVVIHVRIKAASGPGGLLDSINTASSAAPLALPSVVALSRTDLETAALKGLLHPYDGLSTTIDQPDWYTYARQLAMVQGLTFSLPFAGDALMLVYRPGMIEDAPVDWETVFRMGQPMAFSAGDSNAQFILSLYQSIGGPVEDAQRRPILQADLLSQVFQLLADGEQRGIFPYWLTQYETSAQVWQAYRDQRFHMVATWSSYYLTNPPPDSTTAAIPTLDDSPLSLATGWGFAIADPISERRPMAVALAEFLTEGDFQAGWSEAAGYLPARPSALAGWQSQNLKTLLSPIAANAEARPSVDQLSSLGPALKDATLRVLKREADPTQAAQSAAERLSFSETR
jgi:multiple sugar transport system substrate-binding protein